MVDERAIREAWPRVLATLVRRTRDVATAEDALQDAVTRLLATDARPDSVAAWLTTTAQRILVDEARHAAVLDRRMPELLDPGEQEHPDPLELALGDDRLAMLLIACDPALGPETRLALALRFVLGASTADIADVLLVQHTAMSARLTRAKQRIAEGGLAGADAGSLAARLPDLRGVIHALFTLGHASPRGSALDDPAVQRTAIELARGLRRLDADDPETAGLLALMLLTRARAATRHEPLATADRSRWDAAAVDDALDLATQALAAGGRFGLEAGIAGMHTTAPTWEATDWPAIAALHDRLVERWPSPSARLARAVAISHLDGALERALALVDDAGGAPERHVAAARADILRRLGRSHEARAEYRRAMALERNDEVRAFLERRAASL